MKELPFEEFIENYLERHTDHNVREMLFTILHNQHRMEIKMGALQDLVNSEDAEIKQVVTLVQQLQTNPGPTQADFDALKQSLTDLQVVDDADKATIQSQVDEIAAASATVTDGVAQLASVLPAPAGSKKHKS